MGSNTTKNNENLTEEITWGAQVVSLGIDTIKFSFFCNINEPNRFFNSLMENKKEANSTGKPKTIDLYGYPLNMHLQGGTSYPYHLSNGDIHFLIKKRKKGPSEIRIEIGAKSCWYPGAIKVCEDIITWIEKFAVIIEDKISEAHPYVDVLLPMDHSSPFDDRRLITRAKNIDIHKINNKFTGLTIGKGTGKMILCRIYDKGYQLIQSKNVGMISAYKDLLGPDWTDIEQGRKCLIRVEFQLRRRILGISREGFGINSLSEFYSALPSIWKNLTTKWLRLTETKVDRKNKNQKNAKTSEFWKVVSDAMDNGNTCPLKPTKKGHYQDTDSLINIVAGCFTSYAAGSETNDITEALQSFNNLFNNQVNSNISRYQSDIRRKRINTNSFD